MGRLGHIIFWILLVVILGAYATFITFHLDYPIWVGVLIFLAMLLGFIILDSITWAIRKWYKNRKATKAKESGEKIETEGLRLTLENALNHIETNHIAGGAKRFWQMPWIIFFGKTTILLSNGLKLHTHFMVGDAEDEALQRNQVYVLDNFAIWCVDAELLESNTSKKVEKQWLDFLKYIKSQKKTITPIDQIVIELPATKLLNDDKSDIAHHARTLKDRVDQVSLMTGYRQQVLFCITQCNDLNGFDEYVELMPDNLWSQAMGYIVTNPLKDSTSVEPLNYISNRADEVIDIVLFDTQKPIDVTVFNFPSTLRKLEENYSRFTSLFFASSPYTEPAVLHGVYLLGEYQHNGKEESVFYYDFIDQIQLSLIRPMSLLNSEIKQRNKRRWEYLGVWYFAGAIAAGYLIYVYNATSNRLVELIKPLPKKESFSDQLEQNLLQFGDYHVLMGQLDLFRNQLQIKILPYRGGLNRLYAYYSEQYVNHFKQYILALLDKRMEQMLTHGGLTDTQKAYLVQNMVSRINLIQAKIISGVSPTTLMQMPDPQIKYLGYNRLPERFLNTFGPLYKDYVIWNSNSEQLRGEAGKLTLWLDQSHLLASDLRWLLAWANTQDNASELGLNSFWIGSNIVKDYLIAPAYTKAGFAAIQSLLVQINHALPLYIDMSRSKGSFDVWYAETRLNVWKNFALNFYKGTKTLAFQYEWDQTFNDMLQTTSPYNAFLQDLASEFQGNLPFAKPRWIQLVLQFSDLMVYSHNSEQGIEFKQLSDLISDWMKKLQEKPSQWKTDSPSNIYNRPPSVANKLNFNTQVNAAKSYMRYRDLLKQLYKEPYVQSVKAYTNARELYLSQIEVDRQSSLVMQAYQALVDMRRALEHFDQLDASNPFWTLMRGPLDYYIDYTNRFASCYIQQKWLDEVYLRTIALSGEELNQTLFAKGGLVWIFNDKYALPFMKQIGTHFLPRYILGHEFPFKEQYYQLLTFGMRINEDLEALGHLKQKPEERSPVNLMIYAQPTNLDVKATVLPYKTVLHVECKEKEYSLENYNYPSQQKIPNWQLESCGPTEITLFFPGAKLVIPYQGDEGFLHFLQDFDTGIKDFYPHNFPEHAKFLQANKIDKIRVSYYIKGGHDIMWQIAKYFAAQRDYKVAQKNLSHVSKLPRTITDCWAQGEYDV
ncbi:hypothetical protein DGG96_04790 [Legionella qingyii]|uniref:Type VI secretion system component TssM1 N-terminal domain-containing protein n=1 Tax=Legionella qingyii TaxID=2184757 RepID=A0A317U7P9_9GAMM|nr:type VI secretion protein IcmF/TssM N-terminal domain-containing protein [Legionella qingyii]PWY56727.1 hypothetical protein DGG96_04790 [Legionella qingyii]RUR23717.1 hypothetical protein ELY20_06825 [Legionella qingyii]RUR26300.1 hypothetical protein ELY16_07685 [Legionella qingyii]